jgi:hypothetical protein
MCLVVIGRHVDRLKFFDVMFGDKPALKPEELVYQRLLAGDPVEAAEQAQQFLKDKPLLSYYQDILIEGLILAQADAEKGLLNDERTLRIRDTVAEIVDDLDAWKDKSEAATDGDSANSMPVPIDERKAQVPEDWQKTKRVLCILDLVNLTNPLHSSLLSWSKNRALALASKAVTLCRYRVS